MLVFSQYHLQYWHSKLGLINDICSIREMFLMRRLDFMIYYAFFWRVLEILSCFSLDCILWVSWLFCRLPRITSGHLLGIWHIFPSNQLDPIYSPKSVLYRHFRLLFFLSRSVNHSNLSNLLSFHFQPAIHKQEQVWVNSEDHRNETWILYQHIGTPNKSATNIFTYLTNSNVLFLFEANRTVYASICSSSSGTLFTSCNVFFKNNSSSHPTVSTSRTLYDFLLFILDKTYLMFGFSTIVVAISTVDSRPSKFQYCLIQYRLTCMDSSLNTLTIVVFPTCGAPIIQTPTRSFNNSDSIQF